MRLLHPLRLFWYLSILFVATHVSGQDNWPQFRGPQSNNVSSIDQPLPTTWSEDAGVVWKLATELKGWSSPAVWGDRAYMTEATADGSQMYAFAVALDTGKVIWRHLLFSHEKVFEIHLMNSYASPSPVPMANMFGATSVAMGRLASMPLTVKWFGNVPIFSVSITAVR